MHQGSHQSPWHVDFPRDQVQSCHFSSTRHFNRPQVSMRQGNKSANPAFIQASTFVSLLLDLHHPDLGLQRKAAGSCSRGNHCMFKKLQPEPYNHNWSLSWKVQVESVSSCPPLGSPEPMCSSTFHTETLDSRIQFLNGPLKSVVCILFSSRYKKCQTERRQTDSSNALNTYEWFCRKRHL